jgi:hypothetical protein
LHDDDAVPDDTAERVTSVFSITANASFTSHRIKQLYGHRRKIPQRCCIVQVNRPAGATLWTLRAI